MVDGVEREVEDAHPHASDWPPPTSNTTQLSSSQPQEISFQLHALWQNSFFLLQGL